MPEQVSPPTRGAWIETFRMIAHSGAPVSPPTRGAWIETTYPQTLETCPKSPPTRGAWIETDPVRAGSWWGEGRPPRGGRGLKLTAADAQDLEEKVAPHAGGVD